MSTKKAHALIIVFFLFVSLFLTVGRVGTAFDSFALLHPDLGVYATFAAAQDHPDLFVRDPFLADEKNINSYNMIVVPLMKALARVFGNYGTACAVLLPFVIFTHLCGYYLLGVTFFKNPWAGLIVALLLSSPTGTFFDFWGLLVDVLPRFIYQSLIPFVLVLSIRYGRDPRWWPWILGTVGLLNYIHPLSTPGWTMAVMLGLWVSAPQLRFWERMRWMSLSGVVLVLILAPFLNTYVRSTVVETSNVLSYDQTMSILQTHMSSMGAAPLSFLVTGRPGAGLDIIWYLVWMLGAPGLVLGLIWRRDPEENLHLRQLAGWMLGIIFVGGLIPAIERIVFAYLEQVPPEFEIIRTVRYLVPLILLASLLALRLITEYFSQKGIISSPIDTYVFAGASVFLLLWWGLSSQLQPSAFRDAIRQNLACWRHGQLVCDLNPLSMDFIKVMDVIRDETPIGARIFSEGQETSIRYYALRPLVFTYKDGAPLAYTNHKQLLIWKRMYDGMDRLAFIRKFPFRHRAYVVGITELAQDVDSEYLLLQEPYQDHEDYPRQLSIVYTNDHYSLFKIDR